MKRLTLLLVALIAAIIGGTVIYFLVSVPRDLKADRLMREAHDAVKQKKDGEARTKLREVVKNYPRTDAGAAASSALFEIDEQERLQLQREVDALQKANGALAQRVAALESGSRKEAAVTTSTPQEPVVKKAPVRRKAAPKRHTTRRRRRR